MSEPSQLDFKQWSEQKKALLERVLEQVLPEVKTDHPLATLHEAMRYVSLNAGKRVRALLVFAAGELVGANKMNLAFAATAVELIHAYSLVHDDLPCMDNDTLRRGKPTCHIQYDEPTALLVGDALQSLAFEILTEQIHIENGGQHLGLVRLLANAIGSRGMAGGQAIDLACVGKKITLPYLEGMHRLKTGALIRAAVLIGAGLYESPLTMTQWDQLDQFSQKIGLAFQVVDDILDVSVDSAQLGKTAGKDAAQDKPTYVSLLGLEKAREFAQNLYAESQACLSYFEKTQAQRLEEIARFVIERGF